MKKRCQALNLEDFFEKFTFQTLALDFSDKENHMYQRKESQVYASPQKPKNLKLNDLVERIWNQPEDASFTSKLLI